MELFLSLGALADTRTTGGSGRIIVIVAGLVALAVVGSTTAMLLS